MFRESRDCPEIRWRLGGLDVSLYGPGLPRSSRIKTIDPFATDETVGHRKRAYTGGEDPQRLMHAVSGPTDIMLGANGDLVTPARTVYADSSAD